MPNNLIIRFVRNLLLIIYWFFDSVLVDYRRQHLQRLLERKKEPPKCQLLNADVCVPSNSKFRAAIFRHEVSGKNVVVTTNNSFGEYVFISEFLKEHKFVEIKVESDEIKAELELESRVKKQTSLQAGNKPDNHCVVCLEREANMLIYKCGHRCLCLNCGRDLYIKGNGRCPLCRMMITDVIRIYD